MDQIKCSQVSRLTCFDVIKGWTQLRIPSTSFNLLRVFQASIIEFSCHITLEIVQFMIKILLMSVIWPQLQNSHDVTWCHTIWATIHIWGLTLRDVLIPCYTAVINTIYISPIPRWRKVVKVHVLVGSLVCSKNIVSSWYSTFIIRPFMFLSAFVLDPDSNTVWSGKRLIFRFKRNLILAYLHCSKWEAGLG